MKASASGIAVGSSDDRKGGGSRITLGLGLGFGAGATLNGVAQTGLAAGLIQVYLNQVLGAPPLLVGQAIMISLIIDAVADPLIGVWSDRTRSPLGRRHPFLFVAILPAALAFFGLWNPPASLSGVGLIGFSLAMLTLVRLAVSLYEIPSNALTAELTSDYGERTRLQSFRWFFVVVSGAGGSMLLNLVFLRRNGILYRAGYAHWAAFEAIAILIMATLSAFTTLRRLPDLPKAQPRGGQTFSKTLRELRLTLSNRSLAALMGAGFLSGISQSITLGLSIYMFNHFWGLAPKQYGWLAPLHALGSVTAVFVAPHLVRRFGKKPAMLSLFTLAVVTQAGPVFLRLVGAMPVNGSPWILPILAADGFITSGLGIAGYIIAASMVADIVEDAAVRSGVRSEGLLYAAYGLLPKITAGVGALITGVLLTLVHFPAHAALGAVDPAIMRRLALLYLPFTFGISLCALAALTLYRIDQNAHELNLRRLGLETPVDASP